jgi:quercetin dioxygenase-like cupin family protein
VAAYSSCWLPGPGRPFSASHRRLWNAQTPVWCSGPPKASGSRRFRTAGPCLLKIGPSLTSSHELFIASEDMPPGTAIPLHRHERHEEALFLHRGQVTVTLGARRVVAEAGTFVHIPPATWIGVENSGREMASVVGIFAEGTVEPCFRRLVQRPSPADSVRLEQHCAMTFKGKAR